MPKPINVNECKGCHIEWQTIKSRLAFDCHKLYNETMNNTKSSESCAKRRNNGRRDESGKRRRNANGLGTLIKKESGLYLAKWGVGKEKIGERSIVLPDGNIITKPVFKPKYVTESTGTYDLDDAREYLSKRTADLALDKQERTIDKLIEKKDAIAYQRLQLEKQKEEEAKAKEKAAPSMTLMEAFKYYRESSKRPDSGERTLNGYEGQYGMFVDWIHENHSEITEVRQVTSEMADEFCSHLKRSRSVNTYNKYVRFLRTMWRTLEWFSYSKIEENPWKGIVCLKQTKSEITIKKNFEIEELERIAKAIPSDLKMLLVLGLYTGLRLGDCATLQWEDINISEKYIWNNPNKTYRLYEREVYIPIHPVLLGWLVKTPKDLRFGFVMPEIASKYLKEASLITNRFQKALRQAGIKTIEERTDGKRNRAQYGFHSLRHSAASFMINNCAPFAMVEKLLCHSSESMTMRYFHENVRQLTMAILKIPQIQALKQTEAISIEDSQTELCVSNESDKAGSFNTIIKSLNNLPFEQLMQIQMALTSCPALETANSQ